MAADSACTLSSQKSSFRQELSARRRGPLSSSGRQDGQHLCRTPTVKKNRASKGSGKEHLTPADASRTAVY